MRGPEQFIVDVTLLAREAVATSAIEGITLNPDDARWAAWTRLQAEEVAELQAEAQQMDPTLTPERAEQVALKAWAKLMTQKA